MARIVAFYSYKGGVGRSLLAANAATMLALAGKRVLLIDWDIEAPGIGDYFDMDRRIPEAWRTNLGLFDLFYACGLYNKDPKPLLRDYLNHNKPDPSVIRVDLSPAKTLGSLDLLGPGRQVVTFSSDVMNSRWDSFFGDQDQLPDAIKEVASEIPYDFVIADTRTGFSRTTKFAIDQLAEKVIFVSICTDQSLEGTHLMWRLPQSTQSPKSESPQFRLALTRYQNDESADFALKYLIDDHAPFLFPHLTELADEEQLFIYNRELRNGLFNQGKCSPPVRRYCESFWALCEMVSDENLRGMDWGSILSDVRLEALSSTQRRTESMAEAITLVDQVLARAKHKKEQETISPDGTGVNERPDSKGAGRDPADEDLDLWMRSSPLLNRNALRSYAIGKLHDLRLVEADLEDGSRQVLRLELWANPYVSKDSVEGKKAPSAAVAQSALRLWREGLRLRDRDDDPVKAARALLSAIKAIGIEKDQENSLAIYRWEYALTLRNWWEAATGILLHARDSVNKANRSPSDGKTVIKADLSKVILDKACEWMESAGQLPINICRRIDECAEEFRAKLKDPNGPWPGEYRKDGPCLLARYSFYRTAVFEEAQIGLVNGTGNAGEDLEKCREYLRAATEWQRNEAGRASGLYELGRACIALASMSGDDQTDAIRNLDVVKAEGLKVAEDMAQRKVDPDADTMVSIASLFFQCGKFGDALAFVNYARQFAATQEPTGQSSLTNARVLGLNSLLDERLGRTDRASASVEALYRYYVETNVPEGSERHEYLRSWEWWSSAFKWELGEAEAAERELKEYRDAYARERDQAKRRFDKLSGHWSGGFSATEETEETTQAWRYLTQSRAADLKIKNIQSFLPAIKLDLGKFGEAIEDADKWEANLRSTSALTGDYRRSLALCLKVQAEALYLADQPKLADALEKIRCAKLVIAPGAKAFGSYFGMVDAELDILRAQIDLLAGNTVKLERLDEAVETLKTIDLEMRQSLPDHGRNRLYTTQVRVALGIAIASIVFCRAAQLPRARDLATEARELLNNLKPVPQLEWLEKIKALPRVLASVALALAAESDEKRLERREFAKSEMSKLQPGAQKRYRYLLQVGSL